MKKLVLCACLVMALSCPTRAHEAEHHAHHSHEHAAQPVQQEWGIAGMPEAVTRTIVLSMSDTMRFTPDTLTVRVGETVRFKVDNHDNTLHEFVLGTPDKLAEHADIMRHNPDMSHAEPHMAHVQPNKSNDVVWLFNRVGTFGFACLIPGHYEAGMTGTIHVTH